MTMSFESLYTLPLLNEDSTGHLSLRWMPDAKLKGNIFRILKQSPNTTVEELVREFLVMLRSNSENTYYRKHLAAFTSKSTQKVVWDLIKNLRTIKQLPDNFNDFFKDVFHLALETSFDPKKFYKNFDIDRAQDSYWLASLRKYTSARMEGLLCGEVRKIEGMRTYKRTDFYLAHHSSRKEVRESLQFGGIKDNQLMEFELLWKCYEEFKINSEDLNKPQNKEYDKKYLKKESFQLTADRYNQLQKQLSSAAAPNPSLNGDTVEQMLNEIGRAIRSFLDKRKQSLNISISSQESNDSVSFLDQLADPLSVTEGELLSISERQSEGQELKKFLDNLLNGIEPSADRILMLHRGIGLVQKQVAPELGINQSNVSRPYNILVGQILKQLGAWAMQQQGLAIDSETLSAMKDDMIEQIDVYYSALIDTFYQEHFSIFVPLTMRLLRLHYESKMDAQYISQNLNFSTSEVENTRLEAVKSLQEGVQESVEQRIHFRLKPQGFAQKKLETLTEAWLETAPYKISI
jgi:DNA-directed RNA polymerase specialized sigma subunit